MIPPVNASKSVFRTIENKNYRLDIDGKLFIEGSPRGTKAGHSLDRKRWKQCDPHTKRTQYILTQFTEAAKPMEKP
jgi:hypothetical protein